MTQMLQVNKNSNIKYNTSKIKLRRLFEKIANFFTKKLLYKSAFIIK